MSARFMPILSLVASLAAYWLLARSSFYGDGLFIFARQLAGHPGHTNHVLAEPLFAAAAARLEGLGFEPYRAVLACSAVGSALGVALVHTACLLMRVSHARAFLATLLFASLPSTVFFATIIEFHGPFLAFAGGWLVALALWHREKTLGRAALLGVATALAASMHTTGHLLLIPTLLHYIPSDKDGSATVASCATTLASHVATTVTVLATLHTLGWIPGRTTAVPGLSYLSMFAERHARELPRLLPRSAWREFLLPLFPASVVWLAAFRTRATKTSAWIQLLSVVPYVAVAAILLPPDAIHTEHGAYLLPLGMTACLLAARVLRPRVLAIACSIGFATTMSCIATNDRPAEYRTIIDGLQAVAGTREPVVWTADLDETGAILAHRPQWERVLMTDLQFLIDLGAHGSGSPAHDWLRSQLPAIGQAIRDATNRDKIVLLSASAVDFLKSDPNESRFLVWDYLQNAFRLEERRAAGVAATAVLPRS